MRVYRLLATASVAVAAPVTAAALSLDVWRYGGANAAERRALEVAATGLPLDTRALEFLDRQLRPADRFYVHAPAAGFGITDLRTALVLFLGFQLLPNTMAAVPADADVVLGYGRDRSPGVPVAEVVDGPGGTWAARVRDGG